MAALSLTSEKEALLAEHPEALFTIPHFDGYSAVLVHLKAATRRVLGGVIVDGWLAFAPPNLANEYIEQEQRAARHH